MSKQLKIALFGATGMIGSRIAAEAARRGHQVTALARNPERVPAGVPNLKAAQADVLDAASVGAAVRGHDVAASAYAPPQGDVGALEVAPGKQLVDSEGFPDAYKAVALAHRDALGYCRGVADLDWTFFSPAALIAPGERTGKFRTGTNSLIADAEGNSRISAEDYAIAFVDELEQGRFIRQIATVAY
ncbi:MAG: Rrf2-linked NADH-flavin reductase [uncultured Paraburkholderia sp.]|nr:MAG: Rrf2-linked NADH-flavin reductase [uncultured Paraburkholderia sp.]